MYPCRDTSCVHSIREWASFPKVVVNTLCGEQAAECHFHPVSDFDLARVDVRHLGLESAASIKVDNHSNSWRRQGERQVVNGERRNGGGHIRHPDSFHIVNRSAIHGNPHWWQVDRSRSAVP